MDPIVIPPGMRLVPDGEVTQLRGTGTGEVASVTNSQTNKLLMIFMPVLVALSLAVTSWLQSVGTSHEVSLKEAIATAVKEVLAGQQKQTDVIKQDVKPAAPVVVLPPVATPTTVNPLDGLSTEVADKLVADYLKARQEKLKK